MGWPRKIKPDSRYCTPEELEERWGEAFGKARIVVPGEFIRDELEARNWSREHFAGMLRCSLEDVNQIIDGEKEITSEIAATLSRAFGTSSEVWVNLQAAAKERDNGTV